jgi:hypothetical protein
MIRSEAFDVLISKERLRIAQFLNGKEFQLGEIRSLANIGTRQNTYFHLKILIAAGLVERKTTLRKNWNPRSKKSHCQIFRYTLTQLGQTAIQYFSLNGGD